MNGKLRFKRFLVLLVVSLAVLVLGYLAIYPALLRWGASAEEVAASMPGDLSGPRWTRSIRIEGSPQEVWPWLVQWGQGRGGWYSYDWLENLFGLDIHTAETILYEYQNPAIGEDICMGKNNCVSQVAFIEPYRWFGWSSKAEDGSTVWSFTFGLIGLDEHTTRLVMRESFDPTWMPAVAVHALEIPDVVMGQKALDTVKGRVEGRAASPLTTVIEISAWLAAFLMWVFAGVRMVNRLDWRRPVIVVAGAILVLLAITFLFPPLWLRGLLDVILLGGLTWAVRQKPEG